MKDQRGFLAFKLAAILVVVTVLLTVAVHETREMVEQSICQKNLRLFESILITGERQHGELPLDGASDQLGQSLLSEFQAYQPRNPYTNDLVNVWIGKINNRRWFPSEYNSGDLVWIPINHDGQRGYVLYFITDGGERSSFKLRRDPVS